MKEMNQSTVAVFFLLGLTDDPKLQILLFLLFLLLYIFNLVGNIAMITLIISQPRLHTPMYFFLSNLSLADCCLSSAIDPELLNDLLSMKKSISFIGCATQMFCTLLFGSIEVYLLSAMAYDRYAAVCHPLLYPVIIDRSMCLQLVIVAYLSGFFGAAACTGCALYGSFCGPNVIDHFYCEAPLLMKLSCSDTFVREMLFFTVVFCFGCGSLLITVTSYVYIISTILKIPSITGRQKTFSTCSSHLTAISLFYGSTLCMYLRLPGTGSATQNKVVSVCYTLVIPMLNPLIYSLRNQEVKRVIWKLMRKKYF